jgi:hypothetical protein
MSATRRIEIGVLPIGYSDTYVAEGAADPVALMIAEGRRAAEAERAEAERIARQTVTVSREWLLSTLRDYLAAVERGRVHAYRCGDCEGYAACLSDETRIREEIGRYGDEGFA